MKRLIAGATALVCLFLCACGSYRADIDMSNEPLAPMESMMPDPEDGAVTDRDGLIEEPEDQAEHSPAPSSTAKP